jgi:hypothetical protein
MKKYLVIAIVVLLSIPTTAFSHRIDEYLEATILSVGANHVDGSMRLVPGVAVSSIVITTIDTDGNGLISTTEQNAYAQLVLHDLSLNMNGHVLTPRLVSSEFPSLDEIKQGAGEIHIAFTADFSNVESAGRLVFENHHDPAIAVYLVNTLVPAERDIQVTSQVRNENQSVYELDFAKAQKETTQRGPLTFSGFSAAFRLGLRHIAEGTDHVLFLLVLLLPAPLLAFRARWARRIPVRVSLLHILRIVTAFTLGHSLTLMLSVFGLVTLPSRPIEALIAVSILVSAVHSLRALFPGREAAVAAFFGLIHGLAFASALTALGLSGWYRLMSLLGFNLGIETMQLAVVAVTLPSLLLLSRTRSYSIFRIIGASLATIASVCWIAERIFNIRTPVEGSVEVAMRHSLQMSAALFAISLACWFRSGFARSAQNSA